MHNLQHEYAHCTRCPALCQSRTQVVFGNGNPHAEILFIGEAPGATEDTQGIPFCGASGKILSELLSTINLTRDDIFITNTILCRPENNRNPTSPEVENCRERLDQLITLINPKVIVTIGNFATERILGKTGITSMHGKMYPFNHHNREIKVVPVIHPATYLYSGRNPLKLEEMKKDFQTIGRLVQQEKRQKNLHDFN